MVYIEKIQYARLAQIRRIYLSSRNDTHAKWYKKKKMRQISILISDNDTKNK